MTKEKEDVDSVAVFKVYLFLNSSMVERTAVNRDVVGSSPTWGVGHIRCHKYCRWLHGQAVKTPPFHGGNRGSNPLGVTFGSLAQLVRATGS